MAKNCRVCQDFIARLIVHAPYIVVTCNVIIKSRFFVGDFLGGDGDTYKNLTRTN